VEPAAGALKVSVEPLPPEEGEIVPLMLYVFGLTDWGEEEPPAHPLRKLSNAKVASARSGNRRLPVAADRANKYLTGAIKEKLQRLSPHQAASKGITNHMNWKLEWPWRPALLLQGCILKRPMAIGQGLATVDSLER